MTNIFGDSYDDKDPIEVIRIEISDEPSIFTSDEIGELYSRLLQSEYCIDEIFITLSELSLENPEMDLSQMRYHAGNLDEKSLYQYIENLLNSSRVEDINAIDRALTEKQYALATHLQKINSLTKIAQRRNNRHVNYGFESEDVSSERTRFRIFNYVLFEICNRYMDLREG